jgi:WD40 repeat protein
VTCVAFSGDGRLLVSGGIDGSVRLWEVKTGKQMATMKEDPKRAVVRSVAFSPDCALLAVGGDLLDDQPLIGRPFVPTLKVYDVKTGTEKADLKGHKDGVTSVAFSPDGETLVSASFDGTVKLWDISAIKNADK